MAAPMTLVSGFIFIYSLIASVLGNSVIQLGEDTWKQMLNGEWFVEFYAPWCPACRTLAPTWQSFAAKFGKDTEIHVAQVDITENPALSGRFLVTALPTLYHVKDGKFRIYRGARIESAFIDFIKEQKWKDIEILPWYQAPDAYHMTVVSWFFKASVLIRNMHTYITEDFGIPVWGSYLIFAVFTLICGLVLALVLVCLCDCIFPVIDVTPTQPQIQTLEDSKDDESDDVDDTEERESKNQYLRKRKKATLTD